MSNVRLILKNKHGDGDMIITTVIVKEDAIPYLLKEIKAITGTTYNWEFSNAVSKIAHTYCVANEQYPEVTEWV